MASAVASGNMRDIVPPWFSYCLLLANSWPIQ